MRIAMIVAATILCSAVFAEAPRDPTRPPSPAEVRAWFAGEQRAADPSQAFTLQSVLLSPSRRVAIIDGQRLQIGESVGEAVVTTIEAGRVELERDGQTIVLRIGTKLDNEFPISGH